MAVTAAEEDGVMVDPGFGKIAVVTLVGCYRRETAGGAFAI